MMTILLFLARDGGSMHRKEHLDEAERLINFFNDDFYIEHNNKEWRFKEMCEPYCGINKVFEMFKVEKLVSLYFQYLMFQKAYDGQYDLALQGKNISERTELNFPVSNINGFEVFHTIIALFHPTI